MKRSLKSLLGYAIGATDGEIGKVKQVYFDDKTWTIRYFIVQTGSWLTGREVLIAPIALLSTDWEQGIFQTNLTKEQIKASPDIDTQRPVSRQEEIKLYDHYPWGSYWGYGPYVMGVPVSMYQAVLTPDEEYALADKASNDDPHLRSSDKATGYNIKATNGEIGDAEDFIVDDATWKINFLVVDTGNWLPGKKVLVSPKWIKEINWDSSEIIVDASVDSIKNSPEYNPHAPINEDYELSLHDYYGRLVSN